MKYIFLFICCFAMNFITSCKAPDLITPRSRVYSTITALKQGQTIKWDEDVVDSVLLPTPFADSGAAFKSAITNWQHKTFHVVVSVPDSTIHHFKIDRTVTRYSQRDTMGGQRISEFVLYGNKFSRYDQNGNLISTVTLNNGSDSEDFASMPFFEYRPDTLVTDSIRTLFVNSLTAMGYTVTNLGSGGYKVQMTIADSGTSWPITCYFDHDYLTMTQYGASSGASNSTSEYYTYTSVGGYKINTSRITTTTATLPSTITNIYSSNSLPVSSVFFTNTHVNILTISNITLP